MLKSVTVYVTVSCSNTRYILKSLVRTIQDEWLQSENNIALWLGNGEEKLDAKQ